VGFVSQLVCEFEHRSPTFANQFVYQPASAAMKSASQCVLSVYQYMALTWDLYVSQSVNLSASHPGMPAASQLDYVSEYGFPTCVSQSICQQASHPVSQSASLASQHVG